MISFTEIKQLGKTVIGCKKILITIIVTLTISVHLSFGQCISSNTNDSDVGFLNAKVGQSFTASCSGTLESIQVLAQSANSGLTMSVYSGEGISAPNLLGSVSGISFSASADNSDFKSIDFSAESIAITSGNQYTYAFTAGSPQGIRHDNDAAYADGIMFFNGNPFGVLDMMFQVEVLSSEPGLTLYPSSTTGASDDEDGGQVYLVAELDGTSASDVDITFDYSGSATSGVDYTASTTLTITAGDLKDSVLISYSTDAIVETDETIEATINSVVNAQETGTQQVDFTITNDDAATISIGDVSVSEGNSGTKNLTFTATLTGDVDQSIDVDFATQDGTATTADTDYNSQTGTLTFSGSNGETETIDVVINGDTKAEDDEIFTIQLSNVVAGGKDVTFSDAEGEGTITNDDLQPTISIDDVTVTEGNAGTTTAQFTISLSDPSGQTITVDYATANNTATTADGDYDAVTTTTVTFNPGETDKNVDITINGDTKDEADETFFVNLTNPTNATILDNQGEGTINNDDTAPTISIDDVTENEGDAGTTTAQFTISLSDPSGQTITVDYATADNSATTADSDYDAVSTTTVTFNPGETDKTADITINGDTNNEADETFFVNLTNPTNATIIDNQGEGTITNDDVSPPSGSCTMANTNDSDVGFLNAKVGQSFTASCSGTLESIQVLAQSANSGLTMSVYSGEGISAPNLLGSVSGISFSASADNSDFKSIDFSAESIAITSGNQYTYAFTAGSPQGIRHDNDAAYADGIMFFNGNPFGVLDMMFQVEVLSSEPGLTLYPSSTTGASDDEDGGQVYLVAELDGTSASDVDITFDYSGSATSGVDYTASTTLTITAGDLKDSVLISYSTDAIVETDETIEATINSVVNAQETGTQQVDFTITNDDAATISIGDVSVSEGNSGTKNLTFTATLTGDVDQSIDVDFATQDGTATSADTDYNSQIGTLTFSGSNGETETIDVVINGDTKAEDDEIFTIQLSNVVAGGKDVTFSDAEGEGTITNDDLQPTISIDDVTVTEGNAGTTTAQFTISLSDPSGQTITVDYATANNTATTADGDYDAVTTTTVTFNPGETDKTVDVTVNGDINYEDPETFLVNLSNPTNATILDNLGVGTINNDDAKPTISIDDVAENEGNAGTTTTQFTITLSATSVQTITVDYATADNTATTADSDYIAVTTTTVTFNPGETDKTVDITINGDTKDEADETFFVNLTNPTNATILDNQGEGTITNDDTAPTISIDNVTENEGNAGTTTAQFTISLSDPSGKTITVDYVTADNTATTADSDYDAVTTTTVTFNPGETDKTVDITINGDTNNEADETFFVNLTNPTNATILDSQGEGTITNDDTAPTISIDDEAVNEGNAGTVTAQFTISLSGSSFQTITVDYATADNTATTADSDYDAVTITSVTFNPGETDKTVDITINGDTKDEADETFFVNLTNPTNATILDNQGEGTITNDDTAPTISIDDVTVTEGNAGTTTAQFTISLSDPSGQTITVDYATADNTATIADGDYDAVTTTTITFNPGETDKTVDITINGDTKDEADDSFFVNLTNPMNATILDSQGEGTITNDDTAPTISIDDVAENEGNAGTVTSQFTISLSDPSGQTITVDYATADNTATTADSDYDAVTTTTVTFNPGETDKTVDITINGDTKDEADETFFVNLTNPMNATILDNQGEGTITNDDTAPTISIDDVTENEGNAGTTTAQFTISLSDPSGKTISVDYATADNTATTSDSDYDAVTTTTVTFNPGETDKTVDITINGDTKDEADESLFVNLTNPTNATILDNQGEGTITNDDTAPTISIDDVTENEGNAGTTTAQFTISLSDPSGKTITVDYATSDNTATTADGDYDPVSTTTVTFNPGETDKTVDITINGDTNNEADETLFVNLTNPTNATILDSQGEGTITNDDTAPTISIDDVAVNEANAGTVTAQFTISLSGSSFQTITVDYATADNTATTADGDYDAVSTTTVIFNPGETDKTIDITINSDTKDEADETFFVNLTNPTNATILDNQGEGTITNDDTAPTISIDDVTENEGNVGTTTAQFTISLSDPSGQTITVDYATADNTATTADSDYDAVTTTTVTFNPGETDKTVDITINGDTKDEADETFFVNLSNPTNATILDNQGEGTITNDDTAPTISIDDVVENEGNTGTTTAQFTISLSDPSGKTITVDYATSDNTATTADGDYDAITTTTVTFNPGETDKTVDITINGDTNNEADETFFVNLTNPTNATILDSQGEGTIANDDTAPTISIDDVVENERNTGTVTAQFTISLSGSSFQTITVDYATADNTATTADSDYDAVTTTTVTFNPGETDKTVDITINGDTKDEADETFFVNLTNPTNATILDNQGEGTITNDDTAPTISIDDVVENEGNAGTTTAQFTISLSDPSGQTITVDYATADNTATTADSDYDAVTTTTVTFNPGETDKTVDITINGDTKDEADETFFVNLTNPTNATILDNQGEGTITNDDTAPTISIDDVVENEGNAGTTTAQFTISLSDPSGQTITVDYATADNTATTADSDYDAVTTTTVTFNPGQTDKTVDITINGDTNNEADETFFVNLTNSTNATILDNQGEGTITNDDSSSDPTISIDDVTVTEGNTGSTVAQFTISLSASSTETITVDYATADNTATTADGDYDAISNTTVTFNPGELNKTVDVTVNGDTNDEVDETFFVNLTNPTNAIIADDQGEGTITNDDFTTDPEISIDDVSVTEGDAGTTIAQFTVSLSGTSTETITVDYSTEDNTATSADGDYDEIILATITFDPGDFEKTIDITINGDTNSESDETFFVNLTNPTNATIADDQGEGTITNDEIFSTPQISIDNVSIDEGDEGESVAAAFTVTLDVSSTEEITVNYQTEDNTGTSADDDYTEASGTLIFAPGEVSKTIDIDVIGDEFHENDESIFITLSDPVNAAILDNQGTLTISNDDNAPTISVADLEISESDNGSELSSVVISLSAISKIDITVEAITSDNTATVDDRDYDPLDDATLITFNAGDLTQILEIPIYGDLIVEEDESFLVELSNSSHSNLLDSVAEITILNNDTASIQILKSINGIEDENDAQFSVFTNKIFTEDITIDYSVSGDAIEGTDFESLSGSIVIPAFSVSAIQDIELISDDLAESSESILIELTGVDNSNAYIGTASDATIILYDDDNAPSVQDEDLTIDEHLTEGEVVLTLSASDSDDGTTFQEWSITSGNTDIDGDGTLPFVLNASSGELSVSDQGDLDRELTAAFELLVTVSDGTNTSDAGSIVVNLTDLNDNIPVINAQTIVISESTANGTVIGQLTAEDADISSTVLNNWLIISGNDESIFSISTIGELIVSDASGLDFETNDLYQLGVTVSDGTNTSETGIIHVTVLGANDNAPIADVDSYSVVEDGQLTIDAPGVLENDSDADGDNLVGQLVSSPANGVINFSNDGSFIYTPASDFSGTDSFTYLASDGTNSSDETTVAIEVAPVNDSPVFEEIGNVSGFEGQQLGAINLLVSDPDDEIVDLVVTVTSGNTTLISNEGISVQQSTTISLVITPEEDQTGEANITVQVSDGEFTVSQEFTVTIQSSNEAPFNISISEDQILEGSDSGHTVGEFSTSDLNSNDTHTYSFVDPDSVYDNHLFLIEGSNLISQFIPDYESQQEYYINVRSTDDSGEFVEKEFVIEIVQNPELQLDVPTTFTPNGDGFNDTWIIDNISVHNNANVIVFNPEGLKVFESLGYETPWDGTYNGQELPAGTYYYIIHLNDSLSRKVKGFVMIIK